MKTKSPVGILYALKNVLWTPNILKCGLTRQSIGKRVCNLQTSLPVDCEIVCTTQKLINCKIYENLLKKILANYRIRNDREFYYIPNYETIRDIYSFFDEMNEKFKTENELNDFIKSIYPDEKIKYNNLCNSNSITICKIRNKTKKTKNICGNTK